MTVGWDHPDVAIEMRDHLSMVISNEVDKMRPASQSGTVLTLAPGGPTFQVSPENSIPSATEPPPEGPGNPKQVYYATVRLDTGEIITARVADVIPVIRQATFFDPQDPSGDTPYIIALDGTYRNRVVVTRTDDHGQSYQSSEPDMSQHVSGPPYVPPRVSVSGSAGKYVITSIIRGMPKFQNGVLDGGFLIGTKRAADLVDPITPTLSGIRVYSSEFAWNKQGWVGLTGWNASSGFEVELTYGNVFQKYIIHRDQISPLEWGEWMIVPPVFETYVTKNIGFPSDQIQNVLLAQIDPTGFSIHFYVCNFSLTGFSVAPDLYLNGLVLVRSIQSELSSTVDSMPGLDLGTLTNQTWGYTQTNPFELDVLNYARSQRQDKLSIDISNMKQAMTGGGAVTAVSDASNITRLKWTEPFRLVTAKSVYRPHGTFDIAMPPVGFEIPQVGVDQLDGAPLAGRTVSVDGVNMEGLCSLYYVIPFGKGPDSVPGNFVLVSTERYFDIPEHWVMVACRDLQFGSPDFVLGTGKEVDFWHNLSPSGNLTLNSSSPGKFKKENGTVFFRGGFRTTASISSGTSFNVGLVTGYWPVATYRTPIIYFDGTSIVDRFDIETNGNMTVRRTIANDSQIFLDPIQYPAGG